MLVTLREILGIAQERDAAIGAFNAANLEGLQAALQAAQELEQPVILQFAQCHEPWIPLALIGPIMVDAARKASVPVCVHLDHGETFDYLQQALDIGFTGIMYDGSALPYEENLQNTRKAVEMAAITGASVEAELGSMGRREDGGQGEGEGQGDGPAADPTKIYTDPRQAQAFARNTGIHALACSFGTTHGLYLRAPKLDFDVVAQAAALTSLPIVMHGGSGVSPGDYRRAIAAGVRKVNYFTYMDKAAAAAVADYVRQREGKETLYFSTLSMLARDAMREDLKRAIRTFALMEG